PDLLTAAIHNRSAGIAADDISRRKKVNRHILAIRCRVRTKIMRAVKLLELRGYIEWFAARILLNHAGERREWLIDGRVVWNITLHVAIGETQRAVGIGIRLAAMHLAHALYQQRSQTRDSGIKGPLISSDLSSKFPYLTGKVDERFV